MSTRQAKHRAKKRAAGLCACGSAVFKWGRCKKCLEAHTKRHRAYMRERMRARRSLLRSKDA